MIQRTIGATRRRTGCFECAVCLCVERGREGGPMYFVVREALREIGPPMKRDLLLNVAFRSVFGLFHV